MEPKISEYIKNQKVLTLVTSFNNLPYAAACFYAYNEENRILIFSSEEHTQHIKEAIINNSVAGTINSEVTTIAKIKGIQFKGSFISPSEDEEKEFYKIYYKRFPFAKSKPAAIWGVKLNWIKMTDNTLGFGKKIEWEL